jgi:hypothetical protein
MNYSIHSHVCNIDTMKLKFQWDDKMVWQFLAPPCMYTNEMTNMCLCFRMSVWGCSYTLKTEKKIFMKSGMKINPRKVPSCLSCYFSRVINKKRKANYLSLQRRNTANWVSWSFHRFVVENYVLPRYECNLQTTVLPLSLGSDGMEINKIRKTCKRMIRFILPYKCSEQIFLLSLRY